MTDQRTPPRGTAHVLRPNRPSDLLHWNWPLLLALIGASAAMLTLDPVSTGPLAGPGVTSDEPFNVHYGKQYVTALRREGLGMFEPQRIRAIYGPSREHPPLGRWFLGIVHAVFDPLPDNPNALSIARARIAPALAYGLLIFLAGTCAARWYGAPAGALAALALLLMPRVFAHAHFAALDLFAAAAYAATMMSAAWALASDSRTRRSPPYEGGVGGGSSGPPRSTSAGGRARASFVRSILAGAVWGLALLTKVQAVLLPLPIAIWALAYSRRRALLPLALWGVAGLAVFFAGWPWLWISPWDHLLEYLGRTTDRAVLHVWYFGNAYADRAVPWHYPWVIFLTTVPIGLHVLGGVGVAGLLRRDRHDRRDPRSALLLASLAFPLIVFSIPGVPVYDGARLFLMVYPLWAIVVGAGAARVLAWLRHAAQEAGHERRESSEASRSHLSALLSSRFAPLRRRSRLAALLFAGFLAAQAVGLVWMHPYQLSYYNALTAGLWGARGLGLEVTYWGDTINGPVVERVAGTVPPGSPVLLLPTLHAAQPMTITIQFPALYRSGITLVAPHPELPLPWGTRLRPDGTAEPVRCEYILTYNRRADLRDQPWMTPNHLVFELRRQGVRLAALHRAPVEHPRAPRRNP